MKRLICFPFFIFLFCSLSYSAEKQEADSLYAKGLYENALAIYHNILQQEGESPTLYYNIGNCYYRLNNLSYAILSYERAYLLDPSDTEIRTNLQFAQSKTLDKINNSTHTFSDNWWLHYISLYDFKTWQIIGIIAFAMMLIGTLLHLFMAKRSIRKITFYTSSIFFFVVIISNLCAYLQHYALTHRTAAIIIAPSVVVKSSPSTSSSDLFMIHEGTKIEILDTAIAPWCKVRLADGKQGWILNNVAEII